MTIKPSQSIGSSWFYIDVVNPKNISEIDLIKITEIEQDMWARNDGIGEYVKCSSCNNIDSKEDIYWKLSNDIKILTVWKIENILEKNRIECSECGSDSKPIYQRDEYMEEIRNRYNNSDSYISIFRDSWWEIRWFADWYIDSFDTIYTREFEHYYKEIWIDWIKKSIESIINTNTPKELLVWTAVWIEEKYKNFNILYLLIKNFFDGIGAYREGIMWIAESRIWTNTHWIYHSMWAKRLNLSNYTNNNSNFNSDIFIHPWAVIDYKKEFWVTLKQFLRKHSIKMKEVLL